MTDAERLVWIFENAVELSHAAPHRGGKFLVAFFSGAERLEAEGNSPQDAIDFAVVMKATRSQ